ncbi:hypothetical protein GCM10009743_46900 [Kribbella swartbergensis]
MDRDPRRAYAGRRFRAPGEAADVRGRETGMVFDDELIDDDLDELEALGAAEDADLIVTAALGEADA